MKNIYSVVAGNSRVTPIGVALAVALALALRHTTPWAPVVYLLVLVLTLAASTLEPVQ